MSSNTTITVAVSARALFDFEAENEVFREEDPSAYCALQATQLDVPARPGVAFPLVRKLLALNSGGSHDVARSYSCQATTRSPAYGCSHRLDITDWKSAGPFSPAVRRPLQHLAS